MHHEFTYDRLLTFTSQYTVYGLLHFVSDWHIVFSAVISFRGFDPIGSPDCDCFISVRVLRRMFWVSRVFLIFLQSAKWTPLPFLTPLPLVPRLRHVHHSRLSSHSHTRLRRARGSVSPAPEVAQDPVHAWYRRAECTPLLPSLLISYRAARRVLLHIQHTDRCRRCRGSRHYRPRTSRSSTRRRAWRMYQCRHTPRPGNWHLRLWPMDQAVTPATI